MLKIENLKAGYADLTVLNDITLEVEEEKITTIIGPNGSGKSTLLKSIFHLTTLSAGKICFKGSDITKKQTHQLIGLGICFVLQGRQVFADLTIGENLEMAAFSLKRHNLAQEKINKVYALFPILKEKKNCLASTLSGGQQQLLAIARALIPEPKLILLDEPSLGLSPKAATEIFAKIQEIRDSGVTVLVVEQNINQIMEISDKVIVLKNGKVFAEGTSAEIKPKLNEAYF